ncbi:putative DNA-binding domain-containing protein [Cupriavidus sp. JZ107]
MAEIARTSMQQQMDLTRHLRDPSRHPSPAGMDPARVRIYRELVTGNLVSLLGGAFPVLVSLLGAEHWRWLVERFLRDHRSHTPRFGEIAEEFVAFVDTLDIEALPAPMRRPFLAELAHYEWVEMALLHSDARPLAADPSAATRAPAVDRPLQLCPLAWPLAYRWPVHRLGPAYRPSQPPALGTFLLVRRTADDDVRFSELSPLAWQLLHEIGQAGGALTADGLLQALGRQCRVPDLPSFVAAGMALLDDMHADGFVAAAPEVGAGSDA